MTHPIGDPPVDVEELHRPAAHVPAPRRRELAEPTEGSEPPPWWLWALVVSSIFVGGYYLGRHNGGFNARAHTGFLPPVQPQRERPELKLPATGPDIYAMRCASCHQADARGLPGAYPPLVGAEWVIGPPEIPIRIVLLGLTGEITVAGATYRGDMPTWRDQLSDEEIAKVVTHIRELGKAGPVSTEMVAKVRADTKSEPVPMQAETLRTLAKKAAP
ncbi:MAG: c-type cytochrome [Kofleriaceae bacterium]